MKIGVIGAGTWGTALSRMLALSGHEVCVWSALPEEVRSLSETRRQKNLPGMIIPESIVYTSDLSFCCMKKDILLFAVPSVYVRSCAGQAAPFVPDGQLIVDVAKGIEPGTNMTLTQVIEDELSKEGKHGRMVALSGPTHAEEVALDLLTTIVSASRDPEAALIVQQAFMNDYMRVYTNDDILGVELCGSMKNVIALASGISTGLGYGDNAKAAIITRGIAEISRLGAAMGCRKETFAGLAGVGDLIVTATSMHSRNNRAGILMGQGKSPEEAIREVGMVVEGINALPAVMELSEKYRTELPICHAVNRIVREGADPAREVYDLMHREMKSEF